MESLKRVTPIGWDFSLDVPQRHEILHERDGYEPLSAGIFSSSARGVDIVLDIGAHVGFYSLIALGAIQDKKVVKSVEASPYNFEVLKKNLESSRTSANSQAIFGAFGKDRASKKFHVTEASDNCGLSGHPNSPSIEIIDVPGVTSEDFGVSSGSTVLAKVDVEGHEVEALTSLLELRRQSCSIRLLVEYNPKALRNAGSSTEELLSLLQGAEFRIFVIDDLQLTVSEFQGDAQKLDETVGQGYVNLYCLPRDKAISVLAFMHSGELWGSGRSHLEVASDIVAEGGLVTTYLPEGERALAPLLNRAGSAVSSYPNEFGWWAVGENSPLNHSVLDYLRDSRVWSWVFEQDWSGIDIVLTQTSVTPLGSMVAAGTGLPHLWWLREFVDLDYRLKFPHSVDEMGKVIRELSNGILTNSNAVRDHFFSNDGADVKVLYPRPRLRETSPGLSAPSTPVIGVLGTFVPNKGHEVLLEALALLNTSGLKLMGSIRGQGSAPDVARLLGRIESLGLSDQVTIEGPFLTPQDIFSGLSMVVVPSHNEAFGRVPFEAAAFGLPVIYSDSGGLGEFMEDGITGLAFARKNAEDLARKIRRLVEEPAIAASLSKNAYEKLCAKAPERETREELFGFLGKFLGAENHSLLGKALAHEARMSRLARLSEEKARLSEEKARLSEQRYLRISTSLSWKLTSPARRLRNLFESVFRF